MSKKVRFEHKKELRRLLVRDKSITDEKIMGYFREKYRVQIALELIDKTRSMLEPKKGKPREDIGDSGESI